ncbi:MAG: hypothetical protein ACREQY_05105, partial [Candidatus Binatia bacterium]
MTRVRILDPTAPPPGDDLGPGPDAGNLRGKVVGIRLDRAWKSFEWVSDEWSRAFAEAGARVRLWVAGNRIGEEGECTRCELE